MKTFYKRLCTLVLILVITCLCACAPKPNITSNLKRVTESGLYVHYLDVGQGDAILINLPDGKTMMIDAGDREQGINAYVKEFLQTNSVAKIDYFVITHPDSDHVGGAKHVLENFKVDNVYLPKPEFDTSLFPYYEQALEIINDKKINKEISQSYICIKGEDYVFAFLSPLKDDDNVQTDPNSSYVNELSCIIYLEYNGVRFLFTGDASASQEKNVISEYSIGTYDIAFEHYDVVVRLENMDFLKVSHHGANDATSAEFVDFIKPKNAVISVSGNNNYGHPNMVVLERLTNANKNCNLYRTDVHGTITTHVDTEGKIKVIT